LALVPTLVASLLVSLRSVETIRIAKISAKLNLKRTWIEMEPVYGKQLEGAERPYRLATIPSLQHIYPERRKVRNTIPPQDKGVQE
jgi:hypothetical protein